MTGSTEPGAAADAAAQTPAVTTGPRIPDFFIVGHAKSGTTALYEMLRRHPEIYMPELKEPWFFASDMRPRFQPKRAGVPPQTLDEYVALFAAAAPGQRIGAILREPASFLRSLHLQLLQSHVENEQDLRRAISLEAARREGRNVPRRSHR